MESYYKYILVFLGVSMLLKLDAQNPYQEFDKVLAAHQANEVMSYQLKYDYFDDLNTVVASDSMLFRVTQHEDKIYMQAADFVIFQTANKKITVDDNRQEIFIQNFSEPVSFDLKQIKKTAEKMGLELKILPSDNPTKGLVFHSGEESSMRIELIYDIDTYLLSHSSMYFNSYQVGEKLIRLEATYSKYKEEKKFPYTIKTFVRKSDGQWKGDGKYTTYQVTVI